MKTKEEAFDDYFFKIQENHDAVDYILNRKSFEIGVEFAQRWHPVSEFDFEKYDSEYVLLKDSEKSIPVIKQVLCNEDLTDFIFYRPIEIK